MWDLTVTLQDRPGTVADMGEALGAAGINIHGGCGVPCEGVGIIHLLVDDAEAAKSALAGAGIEAGSEREVIVFKPEDRPGELGEKARAFGDAGVNLDVFYATHGGEVVFCVDDVEKGKAALG